MRRITISIFLGLIIPVAWFVAFGFLSDKLPPSILTEIDILDRPAPGILFAPVSLGIYASIFLAEIRFLPSVFGTFWFRILSLILTTWVLYGFVFYLVLGRMRRFRTQSTAYSETPPPPDFESIN